MLTEEIEFCDTARSRNPKCFCYERYPNPFTMSSPLNIKLRLPEAGSVGVEIITVSGMKVKAILANCDAGINTLVWDGKDDGGNEVKSGLYLVKITDRNISKVTKGGEVLRLIK